MMNPIVIVGVVTVSLFAAGMMVSFSGEQLLYSQTVEQISDIQTQRIHEELVVTLDGNLLLLENPGSVPVHLKEIRVLDDDGHLKYQKTIHDMIHPSQNLEISLYVNLYDPTGILEE